MQNVRPIFVDVTKQETIDEAFNQVVSVTDRLDAVINFAGVCVIDSLIEGDINAMQKVMDINLFGTARVNKTFFNLIRKSNGRIINISSENGWTTPSPFNGIYTMSKYALEAYSHSLRRELNLLGIKVINIQPGSFKSNMHTSVQKQFIELSQKTKLYPNEIKKMEKSLNSELESANDFMYLLDALLDAINNDNPRMNYRVKNSSRLSFMSKLPDKMVDNIYYKFFKEDK